MGWPLRLDEWIYLYCFIGFGAMKKKKEVFNDLLIPILLVLCIMPFIIHLAEYSCGYSEYLWYSQDDIIQDLYCYYRSYFFEVVAIITLVVLCFRLGLYKEKTKEVRIFIPIAIYAFMVLISTCFSVNITASACGNFYQFQNIFVLIGYLVMCLYTYQIMDSERDYATVWKGIWISFLVMAVVGIFQLFKKDLLNFPFIQRFIMSAEQYEIYAGEIETVFTGNNVFLTLFNPNYAGVYLVMLICMFGVMCYGEKERRKRIFAGVLMIVAVVLMWFTYSRSTLVALFAVLVIFLLMVRDKARKLIRYIVPGIMAMAIILLFADFLNDWKYMSRIVDEKKECRIQSMVTTKDGIKLCYGEEEYLIAIENDTVSVYDSKNQSVQLQEGEEEFILMAEKPIHIMLMDVGGEEYLYLYIDEYTYAFCKDEDGYWFVNENGNPVPLEEISHVDFKGYEYLGSSRLYIWSRTLPLLKDYLLVGSGPDTFAEVFPQEDYIGKSVYAETSTRIMEKPHNDYLLQWVQNGFVGFAGMIAFYIIFVIKGWRNYRGSDLSDIRIRLGFGCYLASISYMVSCMFNDSTLFTTPVFWVFMGIALAGGQKDCSLCKD